MSEGSTHGLDVDGHQLDMMCRHHNLGRKQEEEFELYVGPVSEHCCAGGYGMVEEVSTI